MSVESEDATANEDPKIDAVSFADALASFGCKMRDQFVSTFATAWERVPNRPREMNFTALLENARIRVREQFHSIVGSVIPSFSSDQELFSSDVDVSDFFGPQRGGDRFLGLYSEEDLTGFIRNSPIGEALAAQGVDDWYIELDLSNCFQHYGYMRRKCLPEKDKYLGYLIVQIGEFQAKGAALPKDINMLNIRWFSLQNPLASFSAKRPRLPGQRYPGSGLAKACFGLICELAKRNSRDGIVNVPEHFHNAFLYENFMFLDPEEQGRFVRISSDLAQDIEQRGLAAVSWAVYLGFLKCNGEKVVWTPHEQVFPLSKRMRAYFTDSDYTDDVKQAAATSGPYVIDWESAEQYCLSAVIEFSSDETTMSSPRQSGD